MKTKTQHTPAPWFLSGHPDVVIATAGGADNGRVIAVNYDSPMPKGWNDPECLANFRLMAAAPELLAALNDLTNAVTAGQHHIDTDPRITAARAVIAKATGE